MLWVVFILLALAVMLILYDLSLSPEEHALIRKDRERRRRRRAAEPASPPPEGDDLMAQIERDPAGALASLGTPEGAERLMAQGIDLEALGYRPPSGE
jgi:hypothetical protein